MASNIKVIVRVRPFNNRELQRNCRIVVDIVDENMIVFEPKEIYQGVKKNYLKRVTKELIFEFDNICGTNATNRDVFEATTKDMFSSLMEGYNCSVYVYGATGAGKTFTMIGNLEHPGITYLTMEHLFYTMSSYEHERDFEIGVSYIEVYNENIFDLLKPSKTQLQLREDHKCGVMVTGLSIFNIKTAQELLQMLKSGNKNRTQCPTDANAESSRSHAIFQVHITMRYKTSSQVRTVKLSMIDLAGSERATACGCEGDRFKECANINKSLLALGNCINNLADGKRYIPYRDSKLTRLLKDSLGGDNCKTVMIANISPSSLSYEDSYNTLKYAARAKMIQLSKKKNIVHGDMTLSQYLKINEDLMKKVNELEAKLTLSNVVTNMAKETEWRRRLISKETTHAALEDRLLALMVSVRVLALRERVSARAFDHVTELAHPLYPDANPQICDEDISRRKRAAEYIKQSALLESQVMCAQTLWTASRDKLAALCEKARADCPQIVDMIKNIELQSELRFNKAKGELRNKLFTIENVENNFITQRTCDIASMIEKLFLILQGYSKATPNLTDEFLKVMKRVKSPKGSTICSDEDVEIDTQLKFISNLDLAKPKEFSLTRKGDGNATVEIVIDSDDFTESDGSTDSDELTDIEKQEPVTVLKRKRSPIKLPNNEIIIINDSPESLATTSNVNYAKKSKRNTPAHGPVKKLSKLKPSKKVKR